MSVDERTNTLLVKDTDEVLGHVKRMIALLDVAVKQVVIEARMVVITSYSIHYTKLYDAELDTLITDVHRGTGDELPYLVLGLAAEGAYQHVRLVADFPGQWVLRQSTSGLADIGLFSTTVSIIP